MPADRTSRASARVSPTDSGESTCPQCQKKLNRRADVKRHMLTHNPTAKKRKCPEPGCGYETLQESNLQTHMNMHKGVKPYVCMDDPANCDFTTRDPASLLRHRQRRHGYKPRPRKGRKQNIEVEIKVEDEHAMDTPSFSSSDNAIAGPSNYPTALEHPAVATLPLTESSPSSSGYTSPSESANAGHFYSPSVGFGGYTTESDFSGTTPMTTPLPQTPPLPQLPMFSVDPLEYEVPQLEHKNECPDEPEQLDVFTKNPSDLLYDVDPTVTGMPNAWIDARSTILHTMQSFELLPPRASTPVFYLEGDHRDGWMGFHTTPPNVSQSEHPVWD